MPSPDEEKLTPERAVRLLRAKGGELENWVLHHSRGAMTVSEAHIWALTADIALVAQLLADHIERTSGGVLFVPDDENSPQWTDDLDD